jgi:hypothetical protein
MELARGREYEVFDRSIDVQVSRLRKLVEDDPGQASLPADRLGIRLRLRAGRHEALNELRRSLQRFRRWRRAPCSGAPSC